MDYIEWCDKLADAVADYAELQHDRWIHLHAFATDFIQTQELTMAAEQAVLRDIIEVLSMCGLDGHQLNLRLRRGDLECLRSHYDRWVAAHRIPLDDLHRYLLACLNSLSEQTEDGFSTVQEVRLETITAELSGDPVAGQLSEQDAREVFDNLERLGLIFSRKRAGLTAYKGRYLGMALTQRAQVARDQEIDALRTQGEGSTLDYKRHYHLKADREKWEFVKDVTALVNAGGNGPRYLLLGVEDNGEFYQPASADAAVDHQMLLDTLTETRAQQIVASRATHAPSVRIAARGEHRHGPYVLLELDRDVAHLPYRIFKDQSARTATNAHELGEVWVRKGSTKLEATPSEIAALQHQAEMYRRILSGSDR